MNLNEAGSDGMTESETVRHDPSVVIEYLLGRKLPAGEIYKAFGMAKSSYYQKLNDGTLVTAGGLINAARHLDINPLDLLLRYDWVTVDDMMDLLDEKLDIVDEKGRGQLVLWRTLLNYLYRRTPP